MTPESSKFKEQRIPAIVQSRKSILRRNRLSNSLVLPSSLSKIGVVSPLVATGCLRGAGSIAMFFVAGVILTIQ